ncbi:MAG: hypothetical protein LBQ75_05225 [Zoogloeaceae bacterium]|nr:hypothetical protein [Zoogloeaceae bacterium]
MDLGALEKFGKLVEKYDFAPHQAVIEVTSSTKRDSRANILESFEVSCKRAGGKPCMSCKGSLSRSARYDSSVFGELFRAKYVRDGFYVGLAGGVGSWEEVRTWHRCTLPNENIEVTSIVAAEKTHWSANTQYSLKYYVIQNNDDIKATEALIKPAQEEQRQAERNKEDEKKRLLQSAVDDWQYASVMLQKNLKPGNTVYFVMEFPQMRSVWFERAGVVVEVKPPMAFIQIQNEQRWVRIEEIHAKVPTILFCQEPIGPGSHVHGYTGRPYDSKSDRYQGRCFQK